MDEKRIMAQVFSGVAKVYDTFLSGITLGGIHRWQGRLIELMGEESAWLDVGTGTGEVLLKLKSSRLKVGIDIAFGMLKKAKEKCGDCHFILADAENTPFKNESFERISLSLVFRHLPSQDNFLKEAYRVMKKGGRIGILDLRKFWGNRVLSLLMRTIFLPFGILIFGKDKWDFFIHSLEKSFTIEETKEILEKNGFKTLKVETAFMGLVYLVVGEKV
ncbi:class I SAM-dependent methyltransferase [Aquifex pyrophilus]